jgi:hypothetical protein
VEWKCDSLNLPSRNAATRFGFSFDGIFHQHLIIKGKNRDTAWYSILDHQWRGALRVGYESWLTPSNFDEMGQQISPLRLTSLSSEGGAESAAERNEMRG